MSIIVSIARAASAIAVISLTGRALAAPPTKEECVDAHAKGQDAREAGQLVSASKLFLSCAQAACPDLVSRECTRLADEVDRLLPSVVFAARDGAQTDLPETTVYVDGALWTSHLGDGKAHEIDPGRHAIRFVHAGKEMVIEAVINQGEKGRTLVGLFPAPTSTPPPAAPSVSVASVAPGRPAEAPARKRPQGPLVLVGLGAAAMVGGGALLAAGFLTMPSSCQLSTHHCAAPPDDPVFGKAARSVSMVNAGAVAGGAGALLLGGSLAWYLLQPLRPAETAAQVMPWVLPGSAGAAIVGTF